jgi:hypothetical protein
MLIPASAPSTRRHAAFHFHLRVDHAAIAGHHVSVSRQAKSIFRPRAQATSSMAVSIAPMGVLPAAHIENGGRSSPNDGRTGLRQLMNRDSADALGGVLGHRSGESDRSGRARQRHADDLSRYSGSRQIHQILRGKFRPVQRWRRTHIERRRAVCWRNASRPSTLNGEQLEQVCKLPAENAPVTTGFSEYHRTSNSRYQSPISAGTSLHTMAVDCAANCGSISATCTSRTRSAANAGRACCVSGIQNVQAGGAGIEVDIIAAVMHGRFAPAVVEAEFRAEPGSSSRRARTSGMCATPSLTVTAAELQQFDHVGRHPHAGIFDQLKGFPQNAFNEWAARVVRSFGLIRASVTGGLTILAASGGAEVPLFHEFKLATCGSPRTISTRVLISASWPVVGRGRRRSSHLSRSHRLQSPPPICG